MIYLDFSTTLELFVCICFFGG